MPNKLLKYYSEKNNIPLKKLEKKWKMAIKLSKKTGNGTNYKYITTVFKKLAKLNEDTKLTLLLNEVKNSMLKNIDVKFSLVNLDDEKKALFLNTENHRFILKNSIGNIDEFKELDGIDEIVDIQTLKKTVRLDGKKINLCNMRIQKKDPQKIEGL
jgi:hypothetical protein